MFHPNRFRIMGPLAAALLGLAAFGAQAQSVTSLVVAFPPGGPADSLARVVATQLEKELKQTVVVENKPGGNGAIAASQVARARPDGQTLFLSSVGAISINPALYPKLIYDPAKDFAPVSLLVSTPEVLIVGPGSPSKTAKDFVARAKSQKGVTMASSGVGSMPHMAIVQLKLSTQANVLHVPYKGAAPAITDTIGGQVDGFIGDISGLMSNIKAGKVKALAIAAPKRSRLLPDVPTFDELGVPNVYANNWYGLFAPKNTPADKIASLNAAVQKVMSSPELKAYADASGVELSPTTPQEFGDMIAEDTKKWGDLIRAEGITANE
ncbi:MAG: tripartite tricarboxylate transporter substrate binding protein [Pigmentiphaga sp.]|uniref:Bug family tripartite tricarboxylate transporter substrate binding protein n=1 Tax=Pigmentiphaga sp. TaxID=1977564 RepID=UPI0029A7C088|nr:tripartite tricarboxylate transporter substrate binding protein [Pigmentiphaga sp.]MDX3907395.1 tripartite tricarboxylate transporter substrate binding protein [Pigmentiphaga sp.]